MNIAPPTLSPSVTAPTERAQPAAQKTQVEAPAVGALAVATPARPSHELTIAFDMASARFVQTLCAAEVVLRRYPNEAQLAFSRGVRAYEKARA